MQTCDYGRGRRTVGSVEGGGVSLAVKYRPRDFDSVVGQRHVTEVLRRSVEAGKLPQQLLFSGRSGLGKTTIARIVAAAVLCETPMSDRNRGNVCGSCESCLIALDSSQAHPDLIEFDAASHGGKDDIRDIAARCHVAPLRSKVKVYIIDEAHGLSGPGGQAFLKLLEEPPEHVIFMLCTTDPQKMLKTNRGRCVEFELLLPGEDDLLGNLRRVCTGEGWEVEDEVLRLVLEVSDPDLGVRGTVGSLAKLASVLDVSSNPSPELVANLLGVAPPRIMARLLNAIEIGDRPAALQELVSLREFTADGAIKAGLRRWATLQVRERVNSSPGLLDLSVWRLEQCLSLPDGPSWLDLLVARLAHPDADGPPLGVVDQAREVLTQLREATTAASAAASSLASAPPVSPAQPGLTPGVAQLLAAAAPAPAGLGDVLALCAVTINESGVHLVAPAEHADQVAVFAPVLRNAAGRLGLPLKMERKSS